MTKKEYQKPAIEAVETDIEEQILASSLRSVKSDGLDAEDDLLYDDTSGDQGYAW